MARCVVLAQAMRVHIPDARIGFLLDAESGHWPDRLAELGFDVQVNDAPEQAGYGLVLDHPDAGQHLDVRTRARMVMFIDDNGRGLPGADLVVHPHPDRSDAAIAGSLALCGAEYALVDPAWSELDGMTADDPVSSVLIAFGMVDSVNASGAVLSALLEMPQRPQKIVIAIGTAAPHRQAVEATAATYSGCNVIVGCSDLKPLVAQAHVILGAGGVSLMERLAAGRVNMVVSQNPEQARLIKAVASCGAVLVAGEMPAFDKATFIASYQTLRDSVGTRRNLAQAGRRLVDGRGAARVASRLAELSAHIS